MKIFAKSILLGGLILLATGASATAQATLPDNFSVAQPSIPDRSFKLTDFGAVADSKTLCTAAFEKAVAACDKAGGGTIVVPAGKFFTGPFELGSNINLHLEAGSEIQFSDQVGNLKVTDAGFDNDLSTKDCHDIAITGSGTIDGNGAYFWRNFVEPKNNPFDAPWIPHRPRLITFTRCTRVLVQGVTLTNSPMFHLVPSMCRDVTIDGVHIKSPSNSPNTDGIDPSGIGFVITNCTIDTGDDDIAVKGSARLDDDQPACENFLIANCTFLHGHGMSIGSESYGGVRNMLVRDCTFNGTDNGIRLKSPRGRGGVAEDLTYENISMKNVKNPILITSWYPKIPSHPNQYSAAKAVTDRTPIWRHIRITNVTSVNGNNAGQIAGLPEMPVDDLVLDNVHVSADKPIEIFFAKGVRFVNSDISSESGKPFLYQAEVEGLE